MQKLIDECSLTKVREDCDEIEKGLPEDAFSTTDIELAYTYINAAQTYVFFSKAAFNRTGQSFMSLSTNVQKGWMKTVSYLFEQNKLAVLNHMKIMDKAHQELEEGHG